MHWRLCVSVSDKELLSRLNAPDQKLYEQFWQLRLVSFDPKRFIVIGRNKKEINMPISRWKKRPDGSNRGDFGPDDQPDYINYLLPQKVKEGIAEVKKGSSFSQNPPFGYPEGEKLDPDRQPPVLRPLLRQNRVNCHCEMDKLVPVKSDIPSDNMVIFFLQYTSHGEGLAHTGSLFDTQGDGIRRPFYYSGFAAGKNIIGPEQIKDSGIPTVSSLPIPILWKYWIKTGSK